MMTADTRVCNAGLLPSLNFFLLRLVALNTSRAMNRYKVLRKAGLSKKRIILCKSIPLKASVMGRKASATRRLGVYYYSEVRLVLSFSFEDTHLAKPIYVPIPPQYHVHFRPNFASSQCSPSKRTDRPQHHHQPCNNPAGPPDLLYATSRRIWLSTLARRGARRLCRARPRALRSTQRYGTDRHGARLRDEPFCRRRLHAPVRDWTHVHARRAVPIRWEEHTRGPALRCPVGRATD